MGVGRLVSTKNWSFSGSKFIYRRVPPNRTPTSGGVSSYCDSSGCHRINQQALTSVESLHTADGRNPAPVDRWCTIIHRVSTIQGGAGFLPSTV